MAKRPVHTPRPILYNPIVTAALALLFTPIFGAQLQALNWDALGERGNAHASRLWVRVTVWLLGAFILMQGIFRTEPLMQYGGIYFLVVTWLGWLVSSGWKQIVYVRDLYGNDYPKQRLGRVLMLGGGGWVIYSMVSLSVALGLTLSGFDGTTPQDPQSEGVVIRVPEGSDKAIVEPLPAPTKPATN